MRKFPIPMPMMPIDPRKQGTRVDREGYLRPMKERWRPTFAGATVKSIEAFVSLVLWLNVAVNLRWQPEQRGKKRATFCDHYAADLLYELLGRQVISAWIWWMNKAIEDEIARTGIPPSVEYLVTVREHGAAGLHAWLQEHGAAHGWREEKSQSGLRKVLNAETTIGLITTKRHVSVALPDACGEGLGVPDGPNILTCQAGSVCTNGRRRAWWGSEPVKFWSYQGEWPTQ